jgi:phytoene synthase
VEDLNPELNGGAEPNAVSLDADYRRCAEITRQSSSNFYYAFMLLPAERRRALYSVYAFCRFVDDVADDESIREPARLLERWREELARVYGEGTPTRAISRALADAVSHFSIPRVHFEELITGMEIDLSRKRYATFEELRSYCYRAASVVGLICIEIFGYTNPDAKVYAENLGIACQLTNILRDVKEDADKGRIYLPQEDLARFGVSEEEILKGVYSDAFFRLMEFEARRAQDYYERAQQAFPPEDRGTLLTAEAMRLIYGSLLARIVSAHYRVLDRRLSLSAPHKLYLVGRAWATSRLGALRG